MYKFKIYFVFCNLLFNFIVNKINIMKKLILILSVLFFLSCEKEAINIIPNAISPNGDGINDTWIIPYESAKVVIFNYNGDVLFSTENYANKFAGFGKRETVFYVINNSIRGSITIL